MKDCKCVFRAVLDPNSSFKKSVSAKKSADCGATCGERRQVRTPSP